MRNTDDYADVILVAISLRALDYGSAKNRRDFLRSGKIKISSFSSSYTKYNLLTAIKNADTNTIISSGRLGLLFVQSDQKRAIMYEQKLLFDHMSTNSHVQTIVRLSLKMPSTSSISQIKNRISSGNLYHQASVFEKVFSDLGKNGIIPKGYFSLGVRTTPISHYYLSQKWKNILSKVKARR